MTAANRLRDCASIILVAIAAESASRQVLPPRETRQRQRQQQQQHNCSYNDLKLMWRSKATCCTRPPPVQAAGAICWRGRRISGRVVELAGAMRIGRRATANGFPQNHSGSPVGLPSDTHNLELEWIQNRPQGRADRKGLCSALARSAPLACPVKAHTTSVWPGRSLKRARRF
jgi:hypothetical protein